MHHETLTYQADGLAMRSELFVEPGAGRKPGVLVFPEAFGLGEHAVHRAQRLAAMGYAALACDLHGEGKVLGTLDEAVASLAPLYADMKKTRARAMGGLQALLARDDVDAARVAAIGFCFGGTMALEMARAGAPVVAAVGFHSGLSTTSPPTERIAARVLVCIGADDPMIPRDQRAAFEAEMTAAGADWQLHVYGDTVHSFTNQAAASVNKPEAVRYSPAADRRSWVAMQTLFAEVLAD